MIDRSSAGSRSEGGLPSNTIVVSCAGGGYLGGALEDTVFARNGVTARQRIESQAGGLHIVEGPHFSLFVQGHLYCFGCDSLDLDQNLSILLERLERGDDLAAALRSVAGGLYGIFVLDHRRRTLAVTVDWQGFWPLYYRADRGAVHFSNDQFSLGAIAALSEAALHEYLKYGYLPFSESLFDSVHRIGPGETITVGLSEHTETCSRDVGRVPLRPLSERYRSTEEASTELVAAFDSYFARFDGRRWAVGLSGGYDSRLIAAYLADREVSLEAIS
jgi:asparagine synthase (glutamine-hydrolysing)